MCYGRPAGSVGDAAQGDGEQAYPTWRLCNFMSEGKPMLAVQQLLIKGLFKQETELVTVQVISRLFQTTLILVQPKVSFAMVQSPEIQAEHHVPNNPHHCS